MWDSRDCFDGLGGASGMAMSAAGNAVHALAAPESIVCCMWTGPACHGNVFYGDVAGSRECAQGRKEEIMLRVG